ncbi:MAG: PEP-CTERM system histidine kinase PrsK [Gammaproteobacteria bacterium]|nr:PEP-CTERM system histidine kinase PrsK [Gammaproteobacteria bacterium]
MPDFGAVSYGFGAILFFLLSVLLATAWRGRLVGGLLLGACLLSGTWCLLIACRTVWGIPLNLLLLLEVVRAGAWMAVFAALLGYIRWGDHAPIAERSKLVPTLTFAFCGLLLLFGVLDVSGLIGDYDSSQTSKLWIVGHIVLSVFGLLWVEQLYRNTAREQRWGLKFLCIGVGGLFAYDFFLYANALLVARIDSSLWTARGFINGLIVPLVGISASRNPGWSVDIFISRQVVFHSATALGAGVYLLVMAAAGYYIRAHGGTWGTAAQAIFFFGAVVLLFALLFSGQLRARLKVFFSKHFFRNRHEYREEWLKFTRTLSRSDDNEALMTNILQGIASIFDSPGGIVFVRQASGFHSIGAAANVTPSDDYVLPPGAPLVKFLEAREWIVDVDELELLPARYENLVIPDWVNDAKGWLLVPLMNRDSLLGVVLLLAPPVKRPLNWEDRDLLKTVGRQAASYLAFVRASNELTDSRQFEAFNRLSAFVVHDLKNLVAQLSLVSANAKRHQDNPEFVRDAMSTVENATNKMSRMLAQLRKDRLADTTTQLVSLSPIINKVVRLREHAEPVPTIDFLQPGTVIRADPERLTSVIEHVVQNAQDATQPDGYVKIRVMQKDESVHIEVEDNGSGMDGRFISERLFKPFETTKGNAGMGIGVYETREFARSRGGDLQVQSKVGAGTTFTLSLPLEGERSSANSLLSTFEANQ